MSNRGVIIPKILIPLWSSKGRDFQIIMPIVYYLEQKKDYDVEIISIWDWYLVDIYKPDLVLFANTSGASINFKCLKYLKRKGYTVLSLVSEGNYVEKHIHDFIWGWNTDKTLYEDLLFLWSKRCLDMILKYYPELNSKLLVSGSVGFDRYKIYNFISKEYFMDKYCSRKYDKVIGYACWAFDLFRTEDVDKISDEIIKKQIVAVQKKKGLDKYYKYCQIKKLIANTLKKTIENNPDILFILKLHPATLDDANTEIEGLDYPNVLILKTEEDISDIINVCDIWMGFDSTTALEAWLLNKPTINLFPPEFEEERTLNFDGSLTVCHQDQLQTYIDEYYSFGSIKAFEKKNSNRKSIIEQIIQWDDGLNHARVGGKIVEIIENKEKCKISEDKLLTRIKLYGIHLLIKNSKYLKKIRIFNSQNFIYYQVLKSDIEHFKSVYYPDLEKFHDEACTKN